MIDKIKEFPDCYYKKSDGNLYKLMQLQKMAVNDLQKDIEDALESLDIYQAYGKTLNLYGETEGQARGLLNDEQYRYMILLRVGIDNVQGTYESIMQVILQMFNCKPGTVKLDDIEVAESKPCVVKLTKFPVQVLIDAGFSSRQATQMIEKLLPIGVSLAADNFDGTFEFAESDVEFDANAGFADAVGNGGGYFGLLLGDDDIIPVLPL